jgi:hypothetical protein
MRAAIRRFAVVLILVLGAGCSSLPRPEVRAVRPRVDGIDFKGVNLAFDVDVFNPYLVATRPPKFRYGIVIAKSQRFEADAAEKVDLPAGAVGTIVLPARVEFLEVWEMSQGLAGADEIDYRLRGTILASALGQSFELDLEHAGTFPVLRPPTFSSPEVEFSDLSLTGGKITVQANVSNPNVFTIGLDRLRYELLVGDVMVGNVQATMDGDLQAGRTGRLSLAGEITARTALLQLPQGQGLGVPKITSVGALKTPYGEVTLPQ